LGLELVLLVLCELVLSLPAGLCELVLSLPYLVLLLFLFLCCCLCSCAVRRDLADVLGVLADVAMISSPLVGGYHSASMVGNQSTGRVSLPGQRCQPIIRSSFYPGPMNCRCGLPNKMPKLVFASHGATWAPQRLRLGSPKRAACYQSRPKRSRLQGGSASARPLHPLACSPYSIFRVRFNNTKLRLLRGRCAAGSLTVFHQLTIGN
jgi:hypothetical protein